MKRVIVLIVLIVLLVLAGGLGFYLWPRGTEVDSAVTQEESTEPQVIIRNELYEIQENDTFTSAMDALGISYSDALAMVESAADVYDLTSIKVGKSFRLVYEDDVAKRIEYESNPDTMVVIQLTDGFPVSIEPIAYDVTIERADVQITNSLFVDGLEAGLPEVLLLKYVDIFAWEVDFATQVQEGDTYTILYEKRSRNGQDAGVGDVLYGTFTNYGETSYSYRFVDPAGTLGYYNQDGDSMVRAFLKAPLSYSRISSGYTNARFHPVTKTTSPHRAIDYAAPMGTPVMAVSDGVVNFSGWNGGYGNLVRIRHNSIYETGYAHLSKISVRNGQSVKQGDVIGLVGSTGFSTGPHLHYEVKVSGELQNPLQVEFPAGDPVPEEYRGAFEEQKAATDALLSEYPGG